MVTSATWGRRNLFAKDRWANLFLEHLFQHRGSAYLLHEFVLMPDHFHILLTPLTTLERTVQFIKGGFSFQAKRELQSSMEVWQRGFSDHRIRDFADYSRHVQYIQLNPVRKQLVTSAVEYPYSSARPEFSLDGIPQGLKPKSCEAASGAAKAAPFQRSEVPQGLKPKSCEAASGAAKAAPFQRSEVPQGLKPKSLEAGSGAAKVAPFQTCSAPASNKERAND
jgi:putative transposase